MILFPNCKINIGLRIIRKREDGFHDLETVFYPIYHLHDALELVQAHHSDSKNQFPVNFTFSGLKIDGDISNNLSFKAYHLLKKDFPDLPNIQMHLHKVIPMGAGLGGGSADGAFALKLLNEKFNLNLTADQLMDYALQLGSDCPFLIINKPSFAWGRGNMMKNINLNLKGYSIILINPGIHINTAWAFEQIIPSANRQTDTEKELQALILQPIDSWKNAVENDFESIVTNAHPIIGAIKSELYKKGAVYASMSGSGSTVYGIFPSHKMPMGKLFSSFFEAHVAL